jgi:2-dehydropantoate 2-reductase
MSMSKSRLAIIGAGGVGGCFGALLSKAGNNVQLLARGAHDAIKTHGPLDIPWR